MLEEFDFPEEFWLFGKLMRYSKFHLRYQSRLKDLIQFRQRFARAKQILALPRLTIKE